MNAHRPLPDRNKRVLWTAFALLVALGFVLLGGMVAAIVEQAYLLTVPLGAMLILLLWRAEHWLMACHRRLERRGRP